MDDKKKPVNGPFTQIPNVFFDTCDLPETAQILFLRLVRKFGYTGGTFTGSIRELGKIVRYSKSTTDRLVKVLRDANLIWIEYDTEGTMTIALNTGDLWALNKHHYEVQASQKWDSKLPSVPEMGQSCPKNGTVRASQKWDKSVPELGQDQAQNQAPKEKEEMKERMKERHSSIHSLALSDDSLEKVAKFAQEYGNDVFKCQERAQEIYQRYAISDDEFYDYFLEAYRCADKSKQMAGLFVKLQIMLEGNFKKRE